MKKPVAKGGVARIVINSLNLRQFRAGVVDFPSFIISLLSQVSCGFPAEPATNNR